MHQTDDDAKLTLSEVEAEFRAFTAAGWAKARSLSYAASAGLAEWSAEDLLQEAITCLLEGTRAWKRGVHPLVTIKVLMRSIASNERKKDKKGPIDKNAVVDTDLLDAEDEVPADATGNTDITPEEAADGNSQYRYLEKLVEGDSDVELLVMAWADGIRGKEACGDLGWDEKHYEAVRQRLLRRVAPLDKLRKTA